MPIQKVISTAARACLPVAVAMLAGCQTISLENETSVQTPKPLPFSKLEVRKADLLDDSPLEVQDIAEQDKPTMERKLDVPDRPQTARTAGHTQIEYPGRLIKGIPEPERKLKVSLQFDANTIDEVVAAFADKDLLNFSFLVDPSVKGAITMSVDAELTAKEAWDTFVHILWLSGAYPSQNPGFIHVLPFEKMPKERRIYAKHEEQPYVEVIFLNIKYRKSADIVNYLRPFMTDGATATDIPDSNTIVIVEAPTNVNKLLELVKRLDTKGESEWPVKCYICREVDPELLAEELNTLLPVLGFPIAAATGPSGGAIKITAIPRLKSIIISASLQEVLDEIAAWIKTLDREDAEDKEEIYFYNVKHSTVASLSAALDAFFYTTTSASPANASSTSSRTTAPTGTTGTTSTSRSRTTSSRSTRNTRSTTPTTTSTTPTSRSNLASSTRTTGNKFEGVPKTVFEVDVTVYTDEESNRLTIKTTPRAWAMIKVFLARQDVPPRQVAIKAIITEITLKDTTEFGIHYAINKAFDSNEDTLAGEFLGAIPETVFSGGGMGLLFKDNKSDPLAFLQAVAGKGNTNILSEPQVIARSGATAELQVGTSVPVATDAYENNSGNFSSNYEYIETGVIMNVTPYITAGNDVRLEIDQEVSSAGVTDDPRVPPPIDKKKMSTELVVPDNSTLFLGGMIQNQDISSKTGIPFLMNIPYIGAIFRTTSTMKVRSELLLLITVNVIDNRNPQEELIRKYKASLELIEKAKEKEVLY
ncbi:MAG: hypothetical protein GX561_03655 [Lentisphaerae bacterium]|jgi:general secretion pathway protein D|nr:hypothetical protein [Lentisphaerota bacterium]